MSFDCVGDGVQPTTKWLNTSRFQLTTHIEKDGVVAGPQVVTIQSVHVVNKTPKDVDLTAGGFGVPPEVTWIIPEKFSIPGKSGLTANVTEAGPNEFKFDLK